MRTYKVVVESGYEEEYCIVEVSNSSNIDKEYLKKIFIDSYMEEIKSLSDSERNYLKKDGIKIYTEEDIKKVIS